MSERSDPDFDALVRAWLVSHPSQNTQAAYRTDLDRFRAWWLANRRRPPLRATTADVDRFEQIVRRRWCLGGDDRPAAVGAELVLHVRRLAGSRRHVAGAWRASAADDGHTHRRPRRPAARGPDPLQRTARRSRHGARRADALRRAQAGRGPRRRRGGRLHDPAHRADHRRAARRSRRRATRRAHDQRAEVLPRRPHTRAAAARREPGTGPRSPDPLRRRLPAQADQRRGRSRASRSPPTPSAAAMSPAPTPRARR